MTSFTRGLIAGTIVGAAVSMVMPNRKKSRMSRTFRNGKRMFRTASSIFENLIDM